MNRINIDGVWYKKEETLESAENIYMVRTKSAGVFVGYLAEREDSEVILNDARRIWYWEGAASLSELATLGTSKPKECKFPCAVSEVTLLEVIEMIPVTKKALATINAVPVWTAH